VVTGATAPRRAQRNTVCSKGSEGSQDRRRKARNTERSTTPATRHRPIVGVAALATGTAVVIDKCIGSDFVMR